MQAYELTPDEYGTGWIKPVPESGGTGKGVTVADVLEVFGGRVLKLDYIESKWNNPFGPGFKPDDLLDEKKEDRCPNSKFYGRFIVEGKDGMAKEVFAFLRCKQWSCPFCAKANARALRTKIKRGIAGCLDSERRDGFSDEYALKFFTGTLPGKEWREEHNRQEAGHIIKKAFKKVVYQLRRKYGHFEYVWVLELQRDGFAHVHAALIGHSVGPKAFLKDLEKLWRDQQALGFIKLNHVKGGAKAISGYLCKYITKDLSSGEKSSHVYGASMGFYKAIRDQRPQITMIERGRFNVEDGKIICSPSWTLGDYLPPESARSMFLNNTAEEEDLWEQMEIPWG